VTVKCCDKEAVGQWELRKWLSEGDSETVGHRGRETERLWNSKALGQWSSETVAQGGTTVMQ
jgi:hypothetical protein